MSDPKQRRSRPGRRWIWVLVGVLALPVILAVALEILVRQPAVREAIKERISAEISARLGLDLEIEQLALGLWSGSASADRVSLGQPGEAPFLTLERIEVELEIASLWDGPLTLRRLRVVAPELDLEAPRPESIANASDAESTGFALAIERFDLEQGRLEASVMPPELETWIDEWWMEDVSIVGRYDPEGLEIAFGADLDWQRHDGVKGEIRLEGGLAGPEQGLWTLSNMRLESDGLQGSFEASFGTGDLDPLDGVIDLSVEPHLLVPVPPAAAPIRIRGEIAGRQGPVSWSLSGTEVPIEIATPWLPESALADPRLRNWRFSVDADGSVTTAESDWQVVGQADLSSSRDGVTWLSGKVELLQDEIGAGPGVSADLELLPSRPGSRTLVATLRLTDWRELGEAFIERAEVVILDTELAELRQDIEELWAEPLPEALEDHLAGTLQATASAKGALVSPRYEMTMAWSGPETDQFEIDLSGTPSRLQIDAVRGSLAGYSFKGRGSADLTLPIATAAVEVELEQPHPEIARLHLTLGLAKGKVDLVAEPELSNGATGRIEGLLPLAALRDVPVVGDALASAPLERAAGPLEIRWQVPRAEWSALIPTAATSKFELAELWLGSSGSLALEMTDPLAANGQVRIDGLELAAGDVQISSKSPIQLRFADRELIVEPAMLETEGGVLEVEVWTRIAAAWQPGDAYGDLVERWQIEANGIAPLDLLSQVVEGVPTDGDMQVAVSLAGGAGDLRGEVRVVGPSAVAVVGDDPSIRLANPIVELAFEGDRIRLKRGQLEIDDGRIGVTGELRLDPDQALQSVGWLEIQPLDLTVGGYGVRNEGPLRVEFDQGRLDLVDIDLRVDDQPFEIGGSVTLGSGQGEESNGLALIEGFELDGRGTIAAALLNPFLVGGIADGLLEVEFLVQGTVEAPHGRVHIRGPEASILFLSPYVAKLEALELDLALADGRVVIEDGRLVLNGGDVELGGSAGLDGAALSADFDGLRFRLDHGLFVRLDGDLDLALDSEARGRLAGEIIVDQGSLTRSISIDRDFLTDILSPIDLTGTEASLLEEIELDLVLKTRRGVRVRNNVADLAVHWNEVEVCGNVLQPVIDGPFAVEPGGRAFLFGQTLRIDKGVMTFPGRPGEEAILDLETTSSLDEPSISRLAGDEALSLEGAAEARGLEDRAREAGWSAAAFVSEQVATRIAEAIPSARFTFRPILIFGEADPEARLTVGRDFSRYVTLAASIDLRNADAQTYLMDAHEFPKLPGLVVQIYTNDLEQEGFTLQHRLRFGAYRRTAPTGPTIRRLAIEDVPNIPKRALRRSVGLVKGDRASADDLFLAEIEVTEFLRTRGYSNARVEVESRPVPERSEKVDLDISIEPGALARFEFSGEKLPRALQRSITPLYRSDFYEPVALGEMESQTVRALRSQGFLFPHVQISVEADQGAEGREERRVSIFMMGGEQAGLETLEFVGLSAAETGQVSEVFGTQLRRVELATAEPSADRRLLSAIRGLGYPEPQIVDREISGDRESLIVTVETGAPQHLASVTVRGVGAEKGSQLVATTGLTAGEIARRDRIAAGALAIESALRTVGFVDALVRPRLENGDTEGAGSAALVYEVDPGPAFTLADTEFSGLRSTSRRWATNVAELESGAPLREDEVAAARSRLYDTGLFTMVRSDSFLTEEGQTQVVFDVEERARFSTAYGLRWDSDEGTQGVVDVVDHNLFGRSITLAVRGLYKTDDWNVRLGAGVPRLFGTRAVLEVFASYQDLFEEVSNEFFTTLFDEQITESSLQVSYPFARHIWGRAYGRYRIRDTTVTDIEEDPIFPLPPEITVTQTKTPLLGTLWFYDSRNRELVLSQGIFASLDLSGTGEFLDSDFEYVRMFGQFNLYRPVKRWAGRRLSWAQSLRLGLADSFDQELDRNDRFFAGGQYSVRGYPKDSLGPVEILGDEAFPLGGKTLIVINEELRFDVYGPLAGLVFLDLGNVWADTAEFGSSLFKSIGFGFRADTPVGLLRLDWAFPLDRRETDPSSQIYFGFGNTF